MVEEEEGQTGTSVLLDIVIEGKQFQAQVSDEIHRQISPTFPSLVKGDAAKAKIIKCPMPGIVTSVRVKNGDGVKKGNSLLIVEAMKMENEIKAPVDGVVWQINVAEGSMVKLNEELIVLK